MKLFKLFTLACMMLTTTGIQAQDPNFWIFLCFGQSNMAGSANIEKQDSIVPDGFMSLSAVDGTDGRKVGEWRKAVPPICRQDTRLSPVDYFGRAVLDAVPAGTRVGVIQVAVEGCPITFFDKDACGPEIAKEQRDWMNNILNQYGRNPYKRLVDMARLAQKEGVIKGILLHQGETDAYDRKWQKEVYKIYKDLQQDLQLDSFSVPMLVGEVVRAEYGGKCAHANPTINNLVDRYHNVYVVSSEGCPPGDDKSHFSAEGYRELGRHYAKKFLDRIKHDETKGKREESHSVQKLSMPDVSVSAAINEKNVLEVEASEALEKVEVVDLSGQAVLTLPGNGAKTVSIDLNELPQETFNFVFKAMNGTSTSLKLEQSGAE